jgi:hypothetical protein
MSIVYNISYEEKYFPTQNIFLIIFSSGQLMRKLIFYVGENYFQHFVKKWHFFRKPQIWSKLIKKGGFWTPPLGGVKKGLFYQKCRARAPLAILFLGSMQVN